MARYMLDTDMCSYIMKRSCQEVLNRLQTVPVTDVCISVITKSELLYGVEVSPHRTQDATALKALLPYTFAVSLLLKGVSIEIVSKLLGHSSIKVTAHHYSPWVKARQDQQSASWQDTRLC